MYLPGHVGLALLAAAAFVVVFGPSRRRGGIGTVLLVSLASAPDVDLYLAGVPHRGITHTVWAALALGCTLSLAGWGVAVARHDRGRALADATFGLLLGVTSVLAHLAGDVITPMGIRPLYPLVRTTETFDLVAARNPDANLALLVAGGLAFVLAVRPHLSWDRTVRTARTRLGRRRERSWRRTLLASASAVRHRRD